MVISVRYDNIELSTNDLNLFRYDKQIKIKE